jgi:hypothetical protein
MLAAGTGKGVPEATGVPLFGGRNPGLSTRRQPFFHVSPAFLSASDGNEV